MNAVALSWEAGNRVPAKGEVLAKRISASGLCSRREAARLVLDARVQVNGNVVVDCSTRVNAADVVAVDGNLVEVRRASRARRLVASLLARAHLLATVSGPRLSKDYLICISSMRMYANGRRKKRRPW